MAKIISKCPSCGGALTISSLHCSDCGMELRGDFQRSPFDFLTSEQTDFLTCFLTQRGNISAVQQALGISYPTAKKKLDDLLLALHLTNCPLQTNNEEDIDMSNWSVPQNSNKASDIIKQKLISNGGRAIVYTARGLPREIRAASDGCSFLCDQLPITPPYRYEVFDVIVDLLISQGGRAQKGNGRNCKLGDSQCDKTTVVGAIGYCYAKKETGASVFDPVFILAAVLEWAGIASNERGELILTPDYQSKLLADSERSLQHC